MSQEKVNPRLIKSNIDLLQKIVKRPAVTEKILSRPPFRFIFDLTTMIIKTTGYLRGLYTEDEFSFEHVSANKETKMAFLDKLIDVIGLINNKQLDCKSAKIVAGVEVEKTNKLLNELAKCVADKKPFVESVEKVRKGFKPESSGSSGGGRTNVNNKTLTKSSVKPTKPAGVKQATTTTKTGQKTSSGKVVAKVDPPPNTEPTASTTMVDGDADIAADDDSSGSISSVRRPSTTTKSLESYRNEPEPEEKEPDQGPVPLTGINGEILVVDKPIVPNEDNDTQMTMMVTGEELSLVSSSFSASDTVSKNKKFDDDGQNQTKEDRDMVEDRPPETSVTAPSYDEKFKEDSGSSSFENQVPSRNVNNNVVTSNEIRNNDDDDGGGAVVQPPPPSAAAANDVVKRLKSSSVTALRSARPKSSRPAPPRVMTASRSRFNQLMDNSNASAAADGGSGGVSAASNVWIPETVDDDNDEFLISSQKLQDSFLTMDDERGNPIAMANSPKTTTDLDTSKGHLVQQLMATKNELEGQIKDPHVGQPSSSFHGLDKPIMNDTNQLRNQIQALCQSIGTLTKAMGYLHEDVGPMVDELKKWQHESEANHRQIDLIRTDMAKDVEPLRKELSQIERQVEDYLEQIHGTRANIYRNEQIIAKLIDSV